MIKLTPILNLCGENKAEQKALYSACNLKTSVSGEILLSVKNIDINSEFILVGSSYYKNNVYKTPLIIPSKHGQTSFFK